MAKINKVHDDVQGVCNEFEFDIIIPKNISKKVHFTVFGHHRKLGVFVEISAPKKQRDLEKVEVFVSDHKRMPIQGVGKVLVTVTGKRGVRKVLRTVIAKVNNNGKTKIRGSKGKAAIAA